ncbi:uncharacterized protein MYCFIDRAFT_195182 [Pseudocercospora fijiensis CIRAD86]|uniref:BTB domain-containing protein n=1 Tax=Pseudocercospora fijiensis (strain CIRAD86) TaxID=383855 RepID=M3B3P1_PSEFD|nr:uncharacterized protein MYCFIDRAFT_195182 [Pseudocercospora fijiensis CIRAD86]EME84003.1 hypothetical protein MYCFIDRAFT_195182 [Pseudocercospora fijiensis CIRAD86]
MASREESGTTPESLESYANGILRLICAYSKYFDSLFRKQFAESKSLHSQLSDVEPWVFRCFLGWLYTGAIYYDFDAAAPPPPRRHNEPTTNETEDDEDGDEDLGGNPVTWPFRDLFELYVFGDYDAIEFRMSVMDLIQAKALQTAPTQDNFPSIRDIKCITSHVPSTSELLRFLADAWQTMAMSSSSPSNEVNDDDEVVFEMQEDMERFPKPFLVLCAKAAVRNALALACVSCGVESDVVRSTAEEGAPKCNTKGHSFEDRLDWDDKDRCVYHEHDPSSNQIPFSVIMATRAHGRLSVKNLYVPETVHIIVGPKKRTFVVPRGLICDRSDYFNKAFQQHFEEEPLDESVDPEGPTPRTKPDKCEDQDFDENDRQDPVTWSYSDLIELFIFADQYDTRLFRNVVIKHFQIKMLQSEPKEYSFFSMREAQVIFGCSPDSSTLYQFALDMLVFRDVPGPLTPKSVSNYAKLPAAALAAMTIKAIQLRQRKDCIDCHERRSCVKNNHPDVAHLLFSIAMDYEYHGALRDISNEHMPMPSTSRPDMEQWIYLDMDLTIPDAMTIDPKDLAISNENDIATQGSFADGAMPLDDQAIPPSGQLHDPSPEQPATSSSLETKATASVDQLQAQINQLREMVAQLAEEKQSRQPVQSRKQSLDSARADSIFGKGGLQSTSHTTPNASDTTEIHEPSRNVDVETHAEDSQIYSRRGSDSSVPSKRGLRKNIITLNRTGSLESLQSADTKVCGSNETLGAALPNQTIDKLEVKLARAEQQAEAWLEERNAFAKVLQRTGGSVAPRPGLFFEQKNKRLPSLAERAKGWLGAIDKMLSTNSTGRRSAEDAQTGKALEHISSALDRLDLRDGHIY